MNQTKKRTPVQGKNQSKSQNSIWKILFPTRKSVIVSAAVVALILIAAVVAIVTSVKKSYKEQYKLDIEVIQGLLNTTIDPEVLELASRDLTDEEIHEMYGQYEVVLDNVGVAVQVDEEKGGDIKIAKKDIDGAGFFYNYTTSNDVFMQLIILKGPDGKIRVGLNTSDECKGEADVYFEKGYGIFKCKHCGHVVADAEVGKGLSESAPVKVPFKSGLSNITISEKDLVALEDYFTNWNGPKNEQ